MGDTLSANSFCSVLRKLVRWGRSVRQESWGAEGKGKKVVARLTPCKPFQSQRETSGVW